MLITWFKFLIIARKAAETAGIYDHAKDVHDPSKEGRTSKAFFYDTVILRLDRLEIERLSTITDCGFSNPAKRRTSHRVSNFLHVLSFNNFRAISFHLNIYKTPFLKERNYVLLIAFGS